MFTTSCASLRGKLCNSGAIRMGFLGLLRVLRLVFIMQTRGGSLSCRQREAKRTECAKVQRHGNSMVVPET